MSEGVVENLRPPAGGAGVWRRVLAAAAGALSLGVAACASIEAPPAPAKVALAAAESHPAIRPNPERKRLMQAFGGEYHAPAIESDLNGVLLKLAPAPNASALPSGDIFVTRGLLALAGDTSEIAAVMAHEIAHVTARHAVQRAEFEKTAALFTRVNAQLLEHAEADDEVQARSKLSIASFSRQQEFEADRIGIKDLGGAGYDPYGAARFLTALGE